MTDIGAMGEEAQAEGLKSNSTDKRNGVPMHVILRITGPRRHMLRDYRALVYCSLGTQYEYADPFRIPQCPVLDCTNP